MLTASTYMYASIRDNGSNVFIELLLLLLMDYQTSYGK